MSPLCGKYFSSWFSSSILWNQRGISPCYVFSSELQTPWQEPEYWVCCAMIGSQWCQYPMLCSKKVRRVGGSWRCNFLLSFLPPLFLMDYSYLCHLCCWCNVFLTSEACLLSERVLGYVACWLLLVSSMSLLHPSQVTSIPLLFWPLHWQDGLGSKWCLDAMSLQPNDAMSM